MSRNMRAVACWSYPETMQTIRSIEAKGGEIIGCIPASYAAMEQAAQTMRKRLGRLPHRDHVRRVGADALNMVAVARSSEVEQRPCFDARIVHIFSKEALASLARPNALARRWLQIGAHDIEHADHDGSTTPDKVYD